MGFGALTSLTGGGGLSSSSSASADGDVSFGGNAFGYRNGSNSSNSNQLLIISGIALAFITFIAVKK